MRVLAIDTALAACSACVIDADQPDPLAAESLPMERGHAEALLPLIERIVSSVPGGFEGLDRVAVTVGPGSYTGLRVGISAARAIGLAAGIPVVGVTTLSALLASVMTGDDQHLVAAAIDARHGQVYFQVVAPGGRTIVPASLVEAREAVRLLGSGAVVLTGSGAAAVASEARRHGIEVLLVDSASAPDIVVVARVGAMLSPAEALPAPLYLRGPDAKAQDHARLARQ